MHKSVGEDELNGEFAVPGCQSSLCVYFLTAEPI